MVQRDSSETKPKKTNKQVRESRSSLSGEFLFLSGFSGSRFDRISCEKYFFPRSKKALYANKGLVEKLVTQTVWYCLLKSFNAHLKTN